MPQKASKDLLESSNNSFISHENEGLHDFISYVRIENLPVAREEIDHIILQELEILWEEVIHLFGCQKCQNGLKRNLTCARKVQYCMNLTFLMAGFCLTFSYSSLKVSTAFEVSLM